MTPKNSQAGDLKPRRYSYDMAILIVQLVLISADQHPHQLYKPYLFHLML